MFKYIVIGGSGFGCSRLFFVSLPHHKGRNDDDDHNDDDDDDDG
jgi:hypothetical protein